MCTQCVHLQKGLLVTHHHLFQLTSWEKRDGTLKCFIEKTLPKGPFTVVWGGFSELTKMPKPLGDQQCWDAVNCASAWRVKENEWCQKAQHKLLPRERSTQQVLWNPTGSQNSREPRWCSQRGQPLGVQQEREKPRIDLEGENRATSPLLFQLFN